MIRKVSSWTDLSAYWSGVAGRKNNGHSDMSVSIWWARGPCTRTHCVLFPLFIVTELTLQNSQIHCYCEFGLQWFVYRTIIYATSTCIFTLNISCDCVEVDVTSRIIVYSQRCQGAIILSYGYILTKAELTFLGHKLQWYSARCRNDDPHGAKKYIMCWSFHQLFNCSIANVIFQHFRLKYFSVEL